jgi:hypothetical protein
MINTFGSLRRTRGAYKLGPILKASQLSGSVQEAHEFVPIDIIVQFSQEIPDKLPKKRHLGVECAKYGEENGFQRPGKH